MHCGGSTILCTKQNPKQRYCPNVLESKRDTYGNGPWKCQCMGILCCYSDVLRTPRVQIRCAEDLPGKGWRRPHTLTASDPSAPYQSVKIVGRGFAYITMEAQSRRVLALIIILTLPASSLSDLVGARSLFGVLEHRAGVLLGGPIRTPDERNSG